MLGGEGSLTAPRGDAGEETPLLEDERARYERRLRELEEDRLHDMTLIKAALRRKLVIAALVIALMILLTLYVWLYDPSHVRMMSALSTGIACGFLAYVAPSLSMKSKLKEYYRLERQQVEREFAHVARGCAPDEESRR